MEFECESQQTGLNSKKVSRFHRQDSFKDDDSIDINFLKKKLSDPLPKFKNFKLSPNKPTPLKYKYPKNCAMDYKGDPLTLSPPSNSSSKIDLIGSKKSRKNLKRL